MCCLGHFLPHDLWVDYQPLREWWCSPVLTQRLTFFSRTYFVGWGWVWIFQEAQGVIFARLCRIIKCYFGEHKLTSLILGTRVNPWVVQPMPREWRLLLRLLWDCILIFVTQGDGFPGQQPTCCASLAWATECWILMGNWDLFWRGHLWHYKSSKQGRLWQMPYKNISLEACIWEFPSWNYTRISLFLLFPFPSSFVGQGHLPLPVCSPASRWLGVNLFWYL